MKQLMMSLVVALGIGLAYGPVAQAQVNDFTITNYEIDYQLSRDSEDRSVLKATETITAQFSQADKNRGIERAIPKSYEGHTTSLKVDSVQNPVGEDWQYTTYGSNGNTVVRIGDPDEYVHGTQVYVITYTQRDVTTYAQTTQSDEFYWNTVGGDWRVPINRLQVQLTISDDLEERLNGNTACYQGVHGSDERCYVAGYGKTFTTTAYGLAPGEDVTLAIGFRPETFAAYVMPLWMKLFNVWKVVQIGLAVVAALILLWASVRFYQRSNRTREQKPIAPEYLPPKEASVVIAARLLGTPKVFTALLLDLAVRHYVKIHEVKEKRWYRQAEFEIEVIKPIDDLRAEEIELLRDVFPTTVRPGARLNLKTLRSSTRVYKNLQDNPTKLKQLVRNEYKFRAVDPAQSAWFRRGSVWLLVIGLVLLSPGLLVVALILFIFSKTLWPLTDKGLSLVRYLKGLKMYITLAEADRIATLQSPEGAEKVGDINDESRLVHLYEKLLPYAVLFGVEKNWNDQLGRHYESLNQQPDWYAGHAGGLYNAAAFSTALNSFQATASATSPTSSSGGSSGGGYSGGGGGGGGGGGW